MKVGWQEIQELLVDPVDHSLLTANASNTELVSATGHRYPVVAGQPILLPAEGLESGGWRFDPIKAGEPDRPKPIRGHARAFKRVKRLLRKSARGQGAGDRLVELLHDDPSEGPLRALVIGRTSDQATVQAHWYTTQTST